MATEGNAVVGNARRRALRSVFPVTRVQARTLLSRVRLRIGAAVLAACCWSAALVKGLLAVSSSLASVLLAQVKAEWVLNLYPDAAEAGGCFVPSRRRPSMGVRGFAKDPERSRVEAARRARGRLRRYCAANRLNRLGTLTYGPPFCTDPVVVRRDVAVFFRALRAELGSEPLAYVWVPELHADGERFHVHFAVGKYVPRGLIEASWGHGFVHIKLLSDLPVGSGSVAEARKAAGYLSKYVGKAIDAEASGHRPFGSHRYDLAQGFTPAVQRIAGRTASEVVDLACEQMGARPSWSWNSDEVEDWKGAPAIAVRWDG